MLARKRHEIILHKLETNGAVMVSDLAASFGVSIETIRRDLFYLEGKNLLQRVHGGAVLPSRMQAYQTLAQRQQKNVEKKIQASQTAMALLQEDEVIFVDFGSTSAEFARVLRESFSKMTVITNSHAVQRELQHAPGFRVIVIGGECAPAEEANLGTLAADMIGKLHAAKAIIFPMAVSLKNGVCVQEMFWVQIQRAYMENADQTIIVADSSKFEKNALVHVCNVDSKNIFVTDAGLSEEIYQAYRENNVQIYRKGEEIQWEK